jgi:heme/copper-type cytochrome/quinol oxidase subunit 2
MIWQSAAPLQRRGLYSKPYRLGGVVMTSRALRILCTGAVTALVLAAVRTSDAHAEERTFILEIKRNVLPPERRTLRVKHGDTVTLEVTADRALVLHIHAFKLELSVNPGSPAKLTFPTKATGRFPVETHVVGGKDSHHHHGPPLAFLEVMPK